MTVLATGFERLVLDAGPVRFSALACGNPADPLMLCLHGMPASSEIWREILPLLASSGRRVVAPDLAGFGATRYAAGWRPTLAANADALCGWVSSTPQRRAWWVGHDLGGAVAQLALIKRPDTIIRMTLSNCPHGVSFPVPAVARLRALARWGLYPLLARSGLMAGRRSTAAIRAAFADRSKLTAELAQRVFWDQKVSSPEGRTAFAAFLSNLDEQTFARETADLTCGPAPIQLVWGMRDRYQPWHPVGEGLARQLGTASIVALDHCGHFGPIEVPEDFAAALLDFQ
ncbi:MAG: alpha/beta fold hydrolase [Betaproteobacteria bacterium]